MDDDDMVLSNVRTCRINDCIVYVFGRDPDSCDRVAHEIYKNHLMYTTMTTPTDFHIDDAYSTCKSLFGTTVEP